MKKGLAVAAQKRHLSNEGGKIIKSLIWHDLIRISVTRTVTNGLR